MAVETAFGRKCRIVGRKDLHVGVAGCEQFIVDGFGKARRTAIATLCLEGDEVNQ